MSTSPGSLPPAPYSHYTSVLSANISRWKPNVEEEQNENMLKVQRKGGKKLEMKRWRLRDEEEGWWGWGWLTVSDGISIMAGVSGVGGWGDEGGSSWWREGVWIKTEKDAEDEDDETRWRWSFLKTNSEITQAVWTVLVLTQSIISTVHGPENPWSGLDQQFSRPSEGLHFSFGLAF